MKLRYLDTSEAGLAWMRKYYRDHPQLNVQKAISSLVGAESVLRDNPFAGSKYEDSRLVRAYPIHDTAFSLLYTVAADTIWIIDVHDQRGYRSAEALRHFTAELRNRMQHLP